MRIANPLTHAANSAERWAIERMSVREPDAPLNAYVYDLDALRQHAGNTVARLPAFCRMYYAMKANSEDVLLRAIRPYVHGFETASIGEARKAFAVDGDVPIIFGGPGKTDGELREAIRLGVERIHVESLHELRRLGRIAEEEGREATILLRVNVQWDLPSATLLMAGKPTQFGMEESDLASVAECLGRLPMLRMAGFHLHSLSNQLSADDHLALISFYLRKMEEWNAKHGFAGSILNAGGGIGVSYSETVPQFDWEKFAVGLNLLGENRLREGKEPPRIDFECGRYLTAFCGVYAAEVIDVKKNHGRAYAIIRGGTHQFRLPASWKHNHPYRVVPVDSWPYPFERPAVADEPVTIVGQLCTPKDVLSDDVRVPLLRSGDVVLFVLAGAYGWAISHHDFLSHPHPEAVFVSSRT
ncbi:type III PLP-dependent enzyme [Cohnella panacarvi]|uniref:type III PLP-dependent enzyme n=1 Tax=Cohnella panacarvi TaxID=400776 RepID=UPI00047A8936|nr:type III PLP-dependent enzyme [Cohnella panacarvi]